MPSRNTIRFDAENSYYHVYARGASKQPIFLDQADYTYFLNLFARYLSNEPAKSKEGFVYPHFRGSIELLAYCLMQNHFHLLVFQVEQRALSKLMKSVMSSYSRYFNLRYTRSGSLFENRFKASLVTNEPYLLHISRYIHLNPKNWRLYPHSSICAYRGKVAYEWLQHDRILAQFADAQSYVVFVADYEDYRDSLNAIKYELADT
jgi:REP element-mobilizing transposase RayT